VSFLIVKHATTPTPRPATRRIFEGSDWPLVSLVMPIRNERGYIATGLKPVLEQDYPSEKLEILVADGMSDDGTREILAEYAARHPRIRVIDNPGRIVSTGLNAAIAAAQGDIILRLDGHAEVARDFVRQNVLVLDEHPEAWSVGGPIRHAFTNSISHAVAIAMSHPLGVGNATHRFSNYEGYVEGAQFPAIRRWVFDKVGNFDEALVRNQDDEFNFRIHASGGKVYVSPRIRFKYFVRDSFRKLARQYSQYGFWRIPTMKKHRRPTTPRQVVPLLFFLTMMSLLIAGIWLKNPWIALAMPAAYLGGAALAGLSLWPRHGGRIALLFPIALVIMHSCYAAGLLYGMVAAVVFPSAWNQQGTMSQLSR
jgi:succinoglycan biosynthesis protein ExoA